MRPFANFCKSAPNGPGKCPSIRLRGNKRLLQKARAMATSACQSLGATIPPAKQRPMLEAGRHRSVGTVGLGASLIWNHAPPSVTTASYAFLYLGSQWQRNAGGIIAAREHRNRGQKLCMTPEAVVGRERGECLSLCAAMPGVRSFSGWVPSSSQ
jgi:hypothetical protein